MDVVAINPGFYEPVITGHPATLVYANFAVDLGNGDGTLTFKAQTQLSLFGVEGAVAGDFDADGHQDLVMIYQEIGTTFPNAQNGAVFLHGNGDGTFSAPVPITLLSNTPFLIRAADLNGDGIEDLVIADDNGTVSGYLANGNGTFPSAPQNLSVFPVAMAVADVTGDGKPDLITFANNGTLAVYGGNGDGTFGQNPLFTAAIENLGTAEDYVFPDGGLAVGDLNGDGLPDIGVTALNSPGSASFAQLNVFLNAGNGNFTADPTSYFAGSTLLLQPPIPLGFLRLNPSGPSSGKNQVLDALVYANGSLTALLNQNNAAPKPVPNVTVSFANGVGSIVSGAQATITAQLSGTLSSAPTGTVRFYAGGGQIGTASVTASTASITAPITGTGPTTIRAVYSGDTNYASAFGFTSITVTNPTPATVTLSTSAASVNEGQSITLTASVQGTSPTGTVTFLNGTTSLGTATLSNGTASFTTSFATAGTLSLTVSYGGDGSNLASTSAPVTVTVAAPDFTISSAPSSASVTPGQSAVFMFTVTPAGGFNSGVSFSCSAPLPAGVSCTFSPSSVTPANGQPAGTKLTISTSGSSAALREGIPGLKHGSPWLPGETIVSIASLLGFIFGRKRLSGAMRRSGLYLLILPAIACVLMISSCSGGGGSGNGTTSSAGSGTPAGSTTVTVTATASAGSQHTTTVTLVVN